MKFFGAITAVFGILTCFQSCLVSIFYGDGAYNAGSIGIVVGALMIFCGVFIRLYESMVDTRKSVNLILALIFLIGAVLGYANCGSYYDLGVWSSWSLICAVVMLINTFTAKKDNSTIEENTK